MTELYSLRSIPQARLQRFTSFEIRKFDADFNCLATYTTSPNSCTCPRGETGKRCRHQEMLNTLIQHKDDGWFYNKDTRQWHRPVLEPTLEEQVQGQPTHLTETGQGLPWPLFSQSTTQTIEYEGECAVGPSSLTPAPEAATPTKVEQTPSPSPVSAKRYVRR